MLRNPFRTVKHLTPAKERLISEIAHGGYIVYGGGYWYNLTTYKQVQYRTVLALENVGIIQRSRNEVTSEVFLTLTDFGKHISEIIQEK